MPAMSTGLYHRRRADRRGPRGPEHPRSRARRRDLHPAHLRASRSASRGRLPAVRGGGGGPGGPPDLLQHPSRGRHGGAHRHRAGQAGETAGGGAAACQPSRRMHLVPGVPQLRAAVAHAVPGVHRRAHPQAGQLHLAHRLQPAHRARHGALHPLWPLRAGLRRTAGCVRHHLRQEGRQLHDRHAPRRVSRRGGLQVLRRLRGGVPHRVHPRSAQGVRQVQEQEGRAGSLPGDLSGRHRHPPLHTLREAGRGRRRDGRRAREGALPGYPRPRVRPSLRVRLPPRRRQRERGHQGHQALCQRA